jgi:putative amide transporter protein
MLTGIVLLYVGAALLVNGIWLIGQARAADVSTREPTPEMAGARSGAASSLPGQANRTDREGHPAQPRRSDAANHFRFPQGREVAVINIFTGFIGVTVATLLVVLGGINGVRSNIADAAFILLFAFTYLWLAANQFLDAGSRAFGWFCFFVAVTAVPTGIYALRDAHGNVAATWLAIDWFVWAVLWFLFFLLLALERPIMRQVGWAPSRSQ